MSLHTLPLRFIFVMSSPCPFFYPFHYQGYKLLIVVTNHSKVVNVSLITFTWQPSCCRSLSSEFQEQTLPCCFHTGLRGVSLRSKKCGLSPQVEPKSLVDTVYRKCLLRVRFPMALLFMSRCHTNKCNLNPHTAKELSDGLKPIYDKHNVNPVLRIMINLATPYQPITADSLEEMRLIIEFEAYYMTSYRNKPK